MSKNTRNRILLTALAALLLVTLTIGGTMAWLVDTTGEVKNTFTTAGIDIDLTETKKGPYKLVPGQKHNKNPIVSVVRDTTDVDIYLFVEFTETNNPSTYLTYTSTLTAANGWTQGTGTGEGGNGIPTNVWYRTVAANATTTCSVEGCTTNPHWHLLDGDTITVKDTVTKENMATAATAQLAYKAYAIQKDNTGTEAEAWTKLTTSAAE